MDALHFTLVHSSRRSSHLKFKFFPSSFPGSTAGFAGQQMVVAKTKEIRLIRSDACHQQKDSSGFGFAFRQAKGKGRQFVVTFIRPESPADRDGTIQIGDRILSINGRDLCGCSLSQAHKWIRETDKLSVVVEYDVAVVDRSQYAHSPLLVELAVKSSPSPLGIHLASGSNNGGIVIESIVAGSIAER